MTRAPILSAVAAALLLGLAAAGPLAAEDAATPAPSATPAPAKGEFDNSCARGFVKTDCSVNWAAPDVHAARRRAAIALLVGLGLLLAFALMRRKAGAPWFALAACSSAALLWLYDAGPRVTYQHVFLAERWNHERVATAIALAVLGLEVVCVAIASIGRAKALREWWSRRLGVGRTLFVVACFAATAAKLRQPALDSAARVRLRRRRARGDARSGSARRVVGRGRAARRVRAPRRRVARTARRRKSRARRPRRVRVARGDREFPRRGALVLHRLRPAPARARRSRLLDPRALSRGGRARSARAARARGVRRRLDDARGRALVFTGQSGLAVRARARRAVPSGVARQSVARRARDPRRVFLPARSPRRAATHGSRLSCSRRRRGSCS